MTLLWADGFEGQEGASIYETYSTIGGYASTTRFTYGQSLNMNNTISDLRKRFTASTDIYIGFAFLVSAVGSLTLLQMRGDTDATQHIVLTLNTDGSITLKRGSTTLSSTAAAVILANTWYYIEVHGKVDDSTGVIDVRLNGSTTSLISFSGDTKNAGTNTTIDSVGWGGANGTNYRIDDLYICNGLGSVNNTWLGDIRIQTLVPTGAGTTTQLTASTGSNWQTVDEAPPSSTDYSGSPTSGNRDTYALTDPSPAPASVLGLVVRTSMHKSDAGAASMKAAIRTNSTVYYGTTRTLASSIVTYTDIWETNPNTSSAFTSSEINALEAGAEVV